jgi:hypothetical protein
MLLFLYGRESRRGQEGRRAVPSPISGEGQGEGQIASLSLCGSSYPQLIHFAVGRLGTTIQRSLRTSPMSKEKEELSTD